MSIALPAAGSSNTSRSQKPAAYVLENTVHHSRFLPRESAHTFVYPTLALLVSLSHLEANALDIAGGRIFYYNRSGKKRWIPRLLSIRPGAYFQDVEVMDAKAKPLTPPTIRVKLESVISRFGHDASKLGGTWMLTMPSYLGVEGINPLTVYYCYQAGRSELWLVVLEVHNTFSEQHVYVLPTGRQHEDENTVSGYQYSWTFPRQFHVSPFNDRRGFYQCSIVAPDSPPPEESNYNLSCVEKSALPKIFLKLLVPVLRDGIRDVKLTATLRAASSAPLTAHGLLFALVKQPFSLFLSFPRIAYQAYALHFKRGLDVYARPEPRAVDVDFEARMPAAGTPVEGTDKDIGTGGTVKWNRGNNQMLTTTVEEWLRRRAVETGITVTIQSADPKYGRKQFPSFKNFDKPTAVVSTPRRHCEILIRSSDVFTLLLISPSAKHALLLLRDAEGLMQVSDDALFIEVFSGPDSAHGPTFLQSINQWMRCLPLPPRLRSDASYSEAISPIHPMDVPEGGRWPWARIRLLVLTYYNFLVIYFFLLQLFLEKFVFVNVLKARFVASTEPWLLWERAAAARKDS